MNRVLQVNMENCGGAFQLIYQTQIVLKDDVKFDYYCMGCFEKNDIYNHLLEMGSKIYEANLRKNRLIGHILLPFKFYSFLKKNKYSVVHINSDSAWKILMYAIPAKFIKIKKVIIHSHSSEINGDHIKIKKICHYIARLMIKYCGTDFCGCSQESVKWMYGNNLENRNVKIINNGVNASKYKFNKDIRKEIRKNLRLNDCCVIGTVGNFSYQKNPEFLIELIDSLKESNGRKYKLLFVGEGVGEKNIKELVKKRNLSEWVIFYGKTDKVNEILNSFDIFIMPSRFEGLPVSGIEAQTNGLPCVFSSRITKEVMISENVRYIDLEEPNEEWCREIENIIINDHREEAYINTIKSNFDISYTSKQLKEMYDQEVDV